MQVQPAWVIETYVGATGLPLNFTFTQLDGTAFDLTGYTLTLTAKLGGTAKMSAVSMTVVSAALGTAKYTPIAGNIDTVGDMAAIVFFTAGGLVRPSRPGIIRVKPTGV